MNEKRRFAMAMLGLPLWLAYPFVFWFGEGARWQVRCAGGSFTGQFDACFNDYIPVIEMMAFPLTLLLLYPFLRFAFILWAPSMIERRMRTWWLARHGGGADYFPSLQLFGSIACMWAIAHLSSYPMASVTAPYILYWMAWIAWLIGGMWISWPREGEELS